MFYNYVLSLQRQTKKQMNYEESNFIIIGRNLIGMQ